MTLSQNMVQETFFKCFIIKFSPYRKNRDVQEPLPKPNAMKIIKFYVFLFRPSSEFPALITEVQLCLWTVRSSVCFALNLIVNSVHVRKHGCECAHGLAAIQRAVCVCEVCIGCLASLQMRTESLVQ